MLQVLSRWLLVLVLGCGFTVAALGTTPAPVDLSPLPSATAFDALFKRLDLGDFSALDAAAQRKLVQQLQALLPGNDAHRKRLLDTLHCGLDFDNAAKRGYEFANAKLSEALLAKDTDASIRFYYCRGAYQESIATPRDSLADYERGIDLARSSDSTALLAVGLAQRGGIYSLLGIYGKALADLLEAQQMFVQQELPEAASQNLQAIGIAYRRLGYSDKAREYLNQSIDHEKRVGDQESLIVSLVQLGYTDEEAGHYTAALDTLRRAHDLAAGSRDRTLIGATRIGIASVLNDLKKYDEAIQSLNKAQADFSAAGDVASTGMLNYERGRSFAGLGQQRKALDAYKDAETIFSASGNRRYQQLLYRAKAESLEASGHTAQALAEYKRYLQAHDDVEEQRANQQAQMLREQFDTQRSNLENTRLKSEKALNYRQVQTLLRVRYWQQIAMGLLVVLLALLILLAIRQLRRLKRWKRMASLDSLTGIANRRSIEHFLAAAIRHAHARHEPLAVLAIDIDRFKTINDSHGHAAGDRVLMRITHACVEALRDGDMLGRIGGEEFLAVLPGSNMEQAMEIAERLRVRVEALAGTDAMPATPVTISLGVAHMRAQDNGIEDIQRRADEALYRAKAAGRNCVASDYRADPENAKSPTDI